MLQVNKKIFVVFVIIVILVIGGAWFYSTSQKQPEVPKYTGLIEKMTFGVEVSLLPAAIWVAEAKGYFEDYGLDLVIKEYATGKDSFLGMLNGEVDVSMVAPTPAMYESFKRDDFYFFSTFAYSDDNIKMIANADSGVSEAKDLIGKKIGTPKGTTGDFFVDTFLSLNGIRSSDVTVMNISPGDLPNALNAGEVDAIAIWEPHATNAQKILGNRAVRLDATNVLRNTFNFMVMRDYSKNNSEALKRFLKAVDKSNEFISNNKTESQVIVAGRLKVEPETLAKLWDEYVFELSLG